LPGCTGVLHRRLAMDIRGVPLLVHKVHREV
jgi:hypothetical protein